MAGDFERDLVGGDFVIEHLGIAHGFGIEFGKVETRAISPPRNSSGAAS